jgi:UDP-N-acetylmuramate--alanine ligase
VTRTVHFVGIGGAGISAIARVMFERGEIVRGSDRAESVYSAGLKEAGVEVTIGHHPENVSGADLIIASSAIPEDNPELVAAREAGIKVLRRKEFLGELTANSQTVAVAGTHGKSTTTGLIAWILSQAGLHPSFIVGAVLANLGTNAGAGDGSHFVIEADEYKEAFLGLRPSVAVVTNMEHDHPDYFKRPEDFSAAFHAFVERVRNLLIVCADDPGAMSLTRGGLERRTYGLSSDAQWVADSLRVNGDGGMGFRVLHEGREMGLVKNLLPGEHNVLNSLAALAVVDYLGVPFKTATEALGTYQGVQRRFQILGQERDVIVIDDYAHHPTEIVSTLAAARSHYPKAAIWAVFQPHTYSRTKTLLDDLVGAFKDADHVIVLDVYAAREDPDPEISGEILAKRIKHPDVRHVSGLKAATSYLLDNVRSRAAVVSLSAGDGNQVVLDLLDELKSRGMEGDDGSQ